jgi:uncharacterized protein
MRLDAYTIVLLRRPKSAPQMTTEELEILQREHVAFNMRMRQHGHALVSGPFADQPDETWRGISIFRTSIEETRALLSGDPLGRAGRLEYEVFTWLMPEGSLGDRPAAQISDP